MNDRVITRSQCICLGWLNPSKCGYVYQHRHSIMKPLHHALYHVYQMHILALTENSCWTSHIKMLTGTSKSFQLVDNFHRCLLFDSYRRMNIYLVFYLSVLVIYAVVWESLTRWFYSESRKTVENIWYINLLPDSFWMLNAGKKVDIDNNNFFIMYCLQAMVANTAIPSGVPSPNKWGVWTIFLCWWAVKVTIYIHGIPPTPRYM